MISAGICGIVHTVALNALNASEYICMSLHPPPIIHLLTFTDDTVDMLIWSATESTVTIMCSSLSTSASATAAKATAPAQQVPTNSPFTAITAVENTATVQCLAQKQLAGADHQTE